MQKELSPLEMTISNLATNPELQPDDLKSIFKKLNDASSVMSNIEKSIEQAKQSVNSLMDNRARTAGKMEALLELIEGQIPDELVQKYGKEYINGRKAPADQQSA